MGGTDNARFRVKPRIRPGLRQKVLDASELIIDDFRELAVYTEWETFWNGVHIQKYPADLWVYQEIITENKPDRIIELGTARGGAAYFYACICDMICHGTVTTLDTYDWGKEKPQHPRLRYIVGDSASRELRDYIVEKFIQDSTVMVSIDTNHGYEQTLKELELWSPVVSVGQYMVVEETIYNGTIRPDQQPGVHKALSEWLPEHPNFKADYAREKFMMTYFPGGWLFKENE